MLGSHLFLHRTWHVYNHSHLHLHIYYLELYGKSWSCFMVHPFMNHQPLRISLLPQSKAPHTKEEGTKTKATKMSKPRRPNPMLISYLSLLLIHTHFSICNGVSAFDLNSLKGSGIDGMVGAGRACNQKIGECLTEPEMESETSRRVLAMQKKYISYETLRRDLVPCGKPGASYYNCHAVAANPYSRGCEVITRCARGNDIKTWLNYSAWTKYGEMEAAISFSFPFFLLILMVYLMGVSGYDCIFETHVLNCYTNVLLASILERSMVSFHMNLELMLITWILGIFLLSLVFIFLGKFWDQWLHVFILEVILGFFFFLIK